MQYSDWLMCAVQHLKVDRKERKDEQIEKKKCEEFL